MNRADRVRKTWEGKEGREFERVAFREGKKERVTLWEGREDSEGVTFREGKEGRGFERVALRRARRKEDSKELPFAALVEQLPAQSAPVWLGLCGHTPNSRQLPAA